MTVQDRHVRVIKDILFLEYVSYNKEKAIETLEKELGWKHYGQKHFESIFTRFYQGYILPVKFNVDKRKAHYSALICSRQMKREEALKAMGEEYYPQDVLREDKNHVINKLGFSEKEFEEIMELPVKSHYDYSTDRAFCNAMRIVKRVLGIS